MTFTYTDLTRMSAAMGFQPESLEKVIHLVEMLNAISAHPFLKSRVVLKGGTALNLFVQDVPRLSVDLDLNYIGAAVREEMVADDYSGFSFHRFIKGNEGASTRVT